MRAARLVVFPFVVLFGVAVGCSNKAAECKAIIDTIDDDDAALKGVSMSADDPAKLATNLKTAADLVDKVAADLATKKVTNADLAKESTDYQDFAKGLAKELRTAADLMTQLGGTLDKLSPMEKALRAGLGNLKKHCTGVDPKNKDLHDDCEAVKKALKDEPDQDAFKFDKDLKDDADAFAKFSAELKGLQLHDADVKKALDDVAKGLGTLEQIMRELSDLKPKFDASQTSMKAVLAKEEPIERHIIDTCKG
jgi:hypothetical protein